MPCVAMYIMTHFEMKLTLLPVNLRMSVKLQPKVSSSLSLYSDSASQIRPVGSSIVTCEDGPTSGFDVLGDIFNLRYRVVRYVVDDNYGSIY